MLNWMMGWRMDYHWSFGGEGANRFPASSFCQIMVHLAFTLVGPNSGIHFVRMTSFLNNPLRKKYNKSDFVILYGC